MRTRPRARTAIGLAALALLLCTGSAAAKHGGDRRCAADAHPGGDWPSLNHDLHNTRHQESERTIGVAQAPSLAPVWRFSVAAAGGRQGFQSTPVVAGGCVYVSTSAADLDIDHIHEPQPFHHDGDGIVFALDADTGAVVWQTEVNGYVLALAVAGGRVYAFPSAAPEPRAPSGFPEPAGAHAVALDAASGKMVWSSERLDEPDRSQGAWIDAAPVVFAAKGGHGRELVFVPLSGGWGDGTRVPLYFLDAKTGATVARFFALPEAAYEAGYGGAGIWTTAAYDEATGHLYAGTADSEAHTRQHPHNNAILKIDADPRRNTFASVVAAYSGTSEHYDLDEQVPGWETNAACAAGTDANELLSTDQSASLTCGELDVDFGSSPTLYRDASGRTLVAALQKSGVLHAVDTGSMTARWTRTLSVPHAFSNAATGATDGADLYVRAFPDAAFSFERAAGTLRWVAGAGAGIAAYQPLTVANGVIYTITDEGEFVALEASTGRTLLRRLLAADAGQQSCYGWGAGVAVARNTVFAPCDADQGLYLPGGPGALIAYRVR